MYYIGVVLPWICTKVLLGRYLVPSSSKGEISTLLNRAMVSASLKGFGMHSKRSDMCTIGFFWYVIISAFVHEHSFL